jgi:transposase
VRARGGGEETGPNPTHKASPGSKHYLIIDGSGIPLAVILTEANTHNTKELEPLVDAIPPISDKPGHPRRCPKALFADRAYDSEAYRRWLWRRGISPHITRRLTPRGNDLGHFRWVVERTLSWFQRPRKLRLRTEWRADIHRAFMSLGCALIHWNILARSF